MPKIEYYKVRAERQDYKGRRYFRVDPLADYALQVIAYPGESKRGTSNNVGIISIASISFYSNYIGPGYCVQCTEKEFEKQFNIVLNALTRGKKIKIKI